jgi:SSS family solute:Na+ symporter
VQVIQLRLAVLVDTIMVSLLTRAPDEQKLAGLVYSLTPRPAEEPLAWYARPASLAIMVLGGGQFC